MLIADVDAEERYRLVNAVYARTFAREPSEIIGRRVAEVVGDALYPQLEPHIRRALSGEMKRFGTTLPLPSGPKVVDAVYIPHTDAAGRVMGFYGLIQDVSKLAEYKRVTAELSRSNALLERIFDSVHIMVAYLDPAFNFIRVNRTYARADNREPEFFIGKNHFDLYPNPENEAIFRQVVATREPYTALAKPFEYGEHAERGVTYWDWTLQPVQDPTGQVEGLVFLLVDVTEKAVAQRQLEEAVVDLRRQAAMMRRAEGLAQFGYWREELAPMKVHWSEGMYRLFGIDPAEAGNLAQALPQTVHPDDYPVLLRHLREVLQGASDTFEGEYRIRRADTGEEHVLFAQGEVERDAAGRPDSLFGITQDVTERRRQEWALRERFRLMAEALDNMVRVSGPAMSEVIYVNPAYERISGRSRSELYARPSSYFDAIHPEHREWLARTLTAPDATQWEAEYRIIRPDGTERWLLERGLPLRDEQGRVNLTIGVARDITKHKHAEEALYRREQEFEALVDRSPDVIARVDRAHRLVYINPAIERLTGRPREWFLGKTPAERELPAQATALQQVFESGAERIIEYTTPSPGGDRYFHSRLVPEFDQQGKVASVLMVDRDITELKQAQQVLERLAQQNPLTGVANRRYLEQFIQREWQREVRHRHPVALIMADIDHFKAYNDRYGHQQGDACLRQVAQVLKSHVRRPTDLLVRYGGEEFAIVLSETDLQEAAQLAEAMHRAQASLKLPHEASPVAPVVTISFGVAAAPAHAISFSELLHHADQALYRAKQKGRNRVEIERVH